MFRTAHSQDVNNYQHPTRNVERMSTCDLAKFETNNPNNRNAVSTLADEICVVQGLLTLANCNNELADDSKHKDTSASSTTVSCVNVNWLAFRYIRLTFEHGFHRCHYINFRSRYSVQLIRTRLASQPELALHYRFPGAQVVSSFSNIFFNN